MRKHTGININLGISSILLIFFVLSMVSFAVLSLSSALTDKKLTDKTVTKNQEYYDACNAMQYELKKLDDTYRDIYASSSSKDTYLESCSDNTTLLVKANDNQILKVVVEPNYPANEGDNFYKILSWKLIYSEQPDIDFSVPVLK